MRVKVMSYRNQITENGKIFQLQTWGIDIQSISKLLTKKVVIKCTFLQPIITNMSFVYLLSVFGIITLKKVESKK